MGMFETWENTHYPNTEQDEFQSCTFCQGEGYREFSVPLLDPDIDLCPNGCDEMIDPNPWPLGPNWDNWEKSVLAADRQPIDARRSREVAQIMRLANELKPGFTKRPIRHSQRSKKPVLEAHWVGERVRLGPEDQDIVTLAHRGYWYWKVGR